MSMPHSLLFLTLLVFITVQSVPPEVCFANFRWDDCGKAPKDVFYYWKPGSRCEIGTWRGCLPNINMFKDEYECVQTCIFTVRARSGDYHLPNDIYNEHVLDDNRDIDEELITKHTDDEDTTTVLTITGVDTTYIADTKSSTILDKGEGADNSTKADTTGEGTIAKDVTGQITTENVNAKTDPALQKLKMSVAPSTVATENGESLNTKPVDTDREKDAQENIQSSVPNDEKTKPQEGKIE